MRTLSDFLVVRNEKVSQSLFSHVPVCYTYAHAAADLSGDAYRMKSKTGTSYFKIISFEVSGENCLKLVFIFPKFHLSTFRRSKPLYPQLERFPHGASYDSLFNFMNTANT